MNSVNGRTDGWQPRERARRASVGILQLLSFFLSFVSFVRSFVRSFVPNANDASFEDQSISGLPNGRTGPGNSTGKPQQPHRSVQKREPIEQVCSVVEGF